MPEKGKTKQKASDEDGGEKKESLGSKLKKGFCKLLGESILDLYPYFTSHSIFNLYPCLRNVYVEL